MAATQGKFYCNVNAFGAEERARYKELTAKLLASRLATEEVAEGYEFRFDAGEMNVQEIAEWVTAESKCCPFFNFRIELRGQGKQIHLRLMGEEGIKEFARAEFGLKSSGG